MWHDLRFAWRQLRRAPAFAATAILTLGLGIGANVGVFSLVNGLVRPLPVANPDEIVIIASEHRNDDTGNRYKFSYPALVDYREQLVSVCEIFGYELRVSVATVDGAQRQFISHNVTANFFTALQLTPAVGRLLGGGEGEALGEEALVVLGHSFWVNRLGSRSDVIGTTIRIDGRPARVVGVAPAGFHGLAEGLEIDGYVTLSSVQLPRQSERLFADRSFAYLTMAGRLKPGVTVATARTAVATVAQRLAAQHPATESGTTARVIPERLARPVPARFISSVLPLTYVLLLTLAALVLLLACVNLFNLLAVRTTVRQGELAVRAALGCGRPRLVRLLLAESFLLVSAGTFAGLFLGWWASTLVGRTFELTSEITLRLDFGLDWRVFSYAFIIAAVTTVTVGVLPALRASRTDVVDMLRSRAVQGTSSGGRYRVRSVLVVLQLVAALVLLVVSATFVRGLRAAERPDVGFEPDQLLTMRLNTSQVNYDDERAARFYDEVERRVRELPGVERAAFSSTLPLGYLYDTCPVEAEGAAVSADDSRLVVGFNTVGTDYFDTLRLALVRGRVFDTRDTRPSMSVMIVNQTMAARLWPNQDPIGKRLRLCRGELLWTVVGVAHDSKYLAAFEQRLPYFYIPRAQTIRPTRILQVRSSLPPRELESRVREQAASLDPDVPLTDVRTMKQVLAGGIGSLLLGFGARQATALGLLALVLALVGVHGVVAYSVNQRRREIGIRLALGATHAQVRWLFLRQSATLVTVGAVVGAIASIVVTVLLSKFLLLDSASSMATIATTAAVLATLAMAAAYVRVHRALSAGPMDALRDE